MRYLLFRWGWMLIDVLFPPECGGCRAKGVRWCSDCHSRTLVIAPPICSICGEPQREESICRRCVEQPPSYEAVRSWAQFGGPVRNALHRLKYHRDIGMGDILAQYLVALMKSLDWRIDIITPVPLGVQRQRERGYNQAALLAQPLSLGLKVAYKPKAIYRSLETQSQVGLTLLQRRENVQGAFAAKGKEINGKNILVVDDVSTSGATLNACSDALLSAGANKVYGLTLARAARSSVKDR